MKQVAIFISLGSLLLATIYYFNKHTLYEEYVLEPRGEEVYSYKVNLNLANEREFINLPGIGPETAKRIISYREKHRFESIEEIMKVKGIGPKTFAEISEYLTMEVY